MAQQMEKRLGPLRLRVRSLASLSGLRIQGCRVARIRPLIWKLPYATGAALKREINTIK